MCATTKLLVKAMKHSSGLQKRTRDIRSTQIYLHADMAIKEQALARTEPGASPGRYRPPDRLLAFLENL